MKKTGVFPSKKNTFSFFFQKSEWGAQITLLEVKQTFNVFLPNWEKRTKTTALVNFLKASVPRKPYSPGGLAGRSSAPRCVDEQWTSTGFEVDSSFVGLQEKPIAPFTLSETVLTSNRPFNFLNAGRLETKRKKERTQNKPPAQTKVQYLSDYLRLTLVAKTQLYFDEFWSVWQKRGKVGRGGVRAAPKATPRRPFRLFPFFAIRSKIRQNNLSIFQIRGLKFLVTLKAVK